MTAIADLPPIPSTARPVPAWVTDPDLIADILDGHAEIDAEFMAVDEPSLKQIEKRIAGWACFYLVCQRAHVADLEQQLAAAYINHTGKEAA